MLAAPRAKESIVSIRALRVLAGLVLGLGGAVLVYAPVDAGDRDVSAALGVALLAVAVGTFMAGLMGSDDGELPGGIQLATAGVTLALLGAGLLGWSNNADAQNAYRIGGGIALALGVVALAVGLTRKDVRA